jgi:hypothetical protein
VPRTGTNPKSRRRITREREPCVGINDLPLDSAYGENDIDLGTRPDLVALSGPDTSNLHRACENEACPRKYRRTIIEPVLDSSRVAKRDDQSGVTTPETGLKTIGGTRNLTKLNATLIWIAFM